LIALLKAAALMICGLAPTTVNNVIMKKIFSESRQISIQESCSYPNFEKKWFSDEKEVIKSRPATH
jgi:hypothetical protein